MSIGSSDFSLKNLQDELYKTNSIEEVEEILKTHGFKKPIYRSQSELTLMIVDVSSILLVYSLPHRGFFQIFSRKNFLGVQASYTSSSIKELAKRLAGEEISEEELNEVIKKVSIEEPDVTLLSSINGKKIEVMYDEDKYRLIEALTKNKEEVIVKLRDLLEENKQ